MKNNAKLIILSGPSGSGKGTILSKVREKIELSYSVSATTRKPREGEVDGVNYHFLTKDEFESRIKNGELLEYTTYCDNYYGTLKSEVESKLAQGKDIVLEIEVIGAMNAKKIFPDALMIFILPPSEEILENRLRRRNTEDEETLSKRIFEAKRELEYSKFYDYTIINDKLDEAVEEFVNIVNKEKTQNI